MLSFGIRDLREQIGSYTAQAEAGAISVITRNGTPLTVNIPFDDILIKLGAHKALAVKLYQEGVLTLNKASRLAGCLWMSLYQCWARPAFPYSATVMMIFRGNWISFETGRSRS